MNKNEGLCMNKKVVTFFAAYLFFLSSNLFAHETKFELPRSVSNFGSAIGVTGSGDSILAWNGPVGANVYKKEGSEWKLQNYALQPDTTSTSWRRRLQSMDVNGNYAAFTSTPDNKVFVYKWDGIEWDATNIATSPTEVKRVAVASNGEIAMQSEVNDRIYVFSSSREKIIRSYGGGPLSDPKTLNGPLEIDGNIMVVSSSQDSEYDKSTIFENWAPVATISEARAIGINAASKAIVIVTSDGKAIELYRYDSNLEENGGWYKVDSIDATELNATEFGYSIDFNSSNIYVAGTANLDGIYGKYANHGIIYNFINAGTKLVYQKQLLSQNFTDSGENQTVITANGKIIIGDQDANKTRVSSTVGGELYSFDLSMSKAINLTLEYEPPKHLHELGDHVILSFSISNNSNNTANNVSFEIDYNSHLGLPDSKNHADFNFISATSDTGNCSEHQTIKNRIVCNIDSFAQNEQVNINIELEIDFVGKLSVFANAYADEYDSNYDDNFSLASINVSTANHKQFATQLESDIPFSETKHNNSPKLSGDGMLLSFQSKNPFEPNADSNYYNVYLVDRYNSVISLISAPITPLNETANNSSFPLDISSDGEIITFQSRASNIVANDNNSMDDIFAYFQSTGEISRISVSNFGDEANGASRGGEISGNGKYITFYSLANNLVENDNNNHNDIFIYDIETSQVSLIDPSISDIGTLKDSLAPSISYDGRFIAFMAKPVLSNTSAYMVFLHDRFTNTTNKVSPSELEDGTPAPSTQSPKISDNAKFVYYPLGNDIYKYNIDSDTTEIITTSIDGKSTNGYSSSPSLSADGRFALYTSSASNLTENDTNGLNDIFIYDSETKETLMVNIGIAGRQAKGSSYHCSISADGTTLAYASIAHNLTLDDTNEAYDIFFAENPFIANKSMPVDLQIISTSPEIETEVNTEFEFNFYITNQSSEPNALASEVLITSAIPDGIIVSSVKSPIGECSINDNTLSCKIGSLQPGNIAEAITIKAKAIKKGKFTFSTNITGAEEEIDTQNNTSQISITAIEQVDLYLSSLTSLKQTFVGDKFTIAYVIGNMSDTVANDVTIELNIPEGLNIISTLIEGGICQAFDDTITCIIDEIQSKAEIGLKIEVSSISHGDMEFFAEIYSQQTDSDRSNNKSAKIITILPKADLMVKVKTAEETIFAGDTITYKISVTNNGLSTAINSKLIDTVANHLTIQSVNTTHGACVATEQKISCDLGTLNSDETATISITTLQNSQEKYEFVTLYKNHKNLKSKIKSFISGFNKNSFESIKKDLKKMYGKQKKHIANWKSSQYDQEKSYNNTAVVSTDTPETNLDNNSASISTNISQKAYLRLFKTGRGKGTVEANGINCSRMCKTTVAKSSKVTITAIPEPGSKFKRWAGACKGKNQVCTLDITRKHMNVIAVFK